MLEMHGIHLTTIAMQCYAEQFGDAQTNWRLFSTSVFAEVVCKHGSQELVGCTSV
jgi:hypothetical protein